ncbi:MAG: serine hydrolase domain-containing protein [Pseudomonadota bacterium]
MKRIMVPALPFLFSVFFFTTAVRGEVLFSPDAIQTWADEYFGDLLERKKIVGASIGVVQNGETVFLKGYGWQDVKARIPIDPSSTRFRMCSTSKTVTATAMMQLVESGLISSLDDPANKYLKRFQIPPPYGDQVTIRHLMTHSSGMANSHAPQGTKVDLSVPLTEEIVHEAFRETIERVPGSVGQYANFGVAIEGLIIEDVSGMALADYVKQHIFEPLAMDTAIFHHSLALPPNLAQPYAYFPDGSLQAVKFYPKHPLTASSGGLITTTEDMLKYAAFHADDEGYRFAEVLAGATRREMQSRQFAHHPLSASVGLHFFQDTFGNERVVHHGCGLPGTFSMLGLFPDSNAASVVSVVSANARASLGDQLASLFGRGPLVDNGEGPQEGPGASLTAFFKALLGPKQKAYADNFETPQDIVDDPQEIVGTYVNERRSFNSYTTLFGSRSKTLTIGEGGQLVIDDEPLTRIATGVYDNEKGSRRYIFRQPQADGPIFLHDSPVNSYRQVHGLANPDTAKSLLAVGWGLALLSVFAVFWRRSTTNEVIFRWLVLLIPITGLAILTALFAGYETTSGIVDDYINGDLTRMTIVVVLINVVAILGVFSIAATVYAWRNRVWGAGLRGVVTRANLTVIALALLLTWPALIAFNLVGVQF